MGIFGGTKKKFDDRPVDIPSDIEEIKRMVNNQPNMKTSQVSRTEEQGQPVWRESSNEEWTQQQPATETWERQEPQQEMAQTSSAPLFVKIDRYRNILAALGAIKGAINLLSNSFAALNELDRARTQTMGVIRSALDKVGKKLDALDRDLVSPAGFSTRPTAEDYQDSRNVESTVADLKGQIQQLKDELQQM